MWLVRHVAGSLAVRASKEVVAQFSCSCPWLPVALHLESSLLVFLPSSLWHLLTSSLRPLHVFIIAILKLLSCSLAKLLLVEPITIGKRYIFLLVNICVFVLGSNHTELQLLHVCWCRYLLSSFWGRCYILWFLLLNLCPYQV